MAQERLHAFLPSFLRGARSELHVLDSQLYFDLAALIYYLLFMVFVLTGPVHSGKTTFLKRLVDDLKRKNLKTGGFLSVAVIKNKEILGYDLYDLKGEQHIPYIRRQGEEGWERIGSYFFIPEALAHARDQLLPSRGVDILVVDEVGPLELKREGLWSALKQTLVSPPKGLILVVRKNILKDFLRQLRGREVRIFDIEEKDAFSQMKKALFSSI